MSSPKWLLSRTLNPTITITVTTCTYQMYIANDRPEIHAYSCRYVIYVCVFYSVNGRSTRVFHCLRIQAYVHTSYDAARREIGFCMALQLRRRRRMNCVEKGNWQTHHDLRVLSTATHRNRTTWNSVSRLSITSLMHRRGAGTVVLTSCSWSTLYRSGHAAVFGSVTKYLG